MNKQAIKTNADARLEFVRKLVKIAPVELSAQTADLERAGAVSNLIAAARASRETRTMARIKGDRVVLEGSDTAPISAWAILVHGHTQPDLLFATQAGAEIYRSYTRHLAGCEIVPVIVSDNVVSRIG